MAEGERESDRQIALQEVLGYLNFSTGAADPRFLRNLNALWGSVAATAADGAKTTPELLADRLAHGLDRLVRQNTAFAQAEQARAVIRLALREFLPRYRKFHRDLLGHQPDQDLWRPFFLGRVFQAVLSQGPPWEETDRILAAARTQLNDYVGYRPIAVLEGEQKMTPYEHEWIRPIPLFIAGAGVDGGPYAAMVTHAVKILRDTDKQLLDQAYFDPDRLAELAFDPRAYDFDHPASRRPNHLFGMWDPHSIDNRGYYRRFVLQQITLDALAARTVTDAPGAHAEQRLVEAAVVLAGTILMGSGVSGSGPDAHDSSTTLGTLVQRIAAYRDAFYAQWINRLPSRHAARLRREAAKFKQPFAGARRHLNEALAHQRATQLQRVHLARLFARMGYARAAARQARAVTVASARILNRIACLLIAGDHAIDAGALGRVDPILGKVTRLLHRAIACGAMVDPWNMVGFGGNFSLFPALENSIHDYRVDALIDLVAKIFSLVGRGWTEASATGNPLVQRALARRCKQLAAWWDPFASASVSGVPRLVGTELLIATESAAAALQAWHDAGATAGDIAFWRARVGRFATPKAFTLVINALLEKGDLVASMALLMQWLNQADTTPLAEGENSFHQLADRWLRTAALPRDEANPTADRWELVRKFFDYLEANADVYWEVPGLGSSPAGPAAEQTRCDTLDDRSGSVEMDGQDGEESFLYRAAYEDVVYRDSTDDGVEGDVIGQTPAEDQLAEQERSLLGRLAFLTNLGRLWKRTAIIWSAAGRLPAGRQSVLLGWQRQAQSDGAQLLDLLKQILGRPVAVASAAPAAILDYHRRRMVKERLLDRAASSCLAMAEANHFLAAATTLGPEPVAVDRAGVVTGAVLTANVSAVQRNWKEFLCETRDQILLYMPLGRGGKPKSVIDARANRRFIEELLGALPRLGLLRETCELVETAQAMEAATTVGRVAVVSEFDQLFAVALNATADCVVTAAAGPAHKPPTSGHEATAETVGDDDLLDCLQELTEWYLKRWFHHSGRLRLSAAERVLRQEDWERLVQFIQRFGHDLLTQQVLTEHSARAILLQGVGGWLERLATTADGPERPALMDELGASVSRAEATMHLTTVLELVVENSAEYRDYNTTTSQSDRGELLYQFVDFLRLKSEYDRVAWNLKPMMLVHSVLVRRGRMEAAARWRQALAERTAETADRFSAQLDQLSQTYGMRVSTVADRFAERFVQPLVIDHIRALVGPAMEAARRGQVDSRFAQLADMIEDLASVPRGAGFDLPTWLEALEDEVDRIQVARGAEVPLVDSSVPEIHLTWQQVWDQMPRDE